MKIIGCLIWLGLLVFFLLFPEWRGRVVFFFQYDVPKFFRALYGGVLLSVLRVGRFMVLCLAAGSISIFANEVAAIFGLAPFFSGSSYTALLGLFSEKSTWAVVTTIVATTVAMSNTRKLDMDDFDFELRKQERRQKAEEKLEERVGRRSVPVVRPSWRKKDSRSGFARNF
ncbi:hypothetical protein FNU76_01760 [Chitinimonas arctica]|uniref:Uncharacterized protein n=1 Tax=Chitinimonas arctica TaxID=2594795 RepID=A0A516SAK4_9NEIS|nr:hypothetical protein [Chitinimonas arctica]QDQ25184.1 hypothetical protein FNU76_01760 [Chitinimonas arctica]